MENYEDVFVKKSLVEKTRGINSLQFKYKTSKPVVTNSPVITVRDKRQILFNNVKMSINNTARHSNANVYTIGFATEGICPHWFDNNVD